MLIRCDRCSTLYELDEALLSPEGSPVQCTRCDHVFTARPSSQPGDGAQPTPPPDRFEPPPPPVEQEEPLDEELPGPPTPAASNPRHTAPPQRWDRPGPPVYRPGTSTSTPSVARPPQIRRDAVGAFEARLRRSARWRWLAPTLVVLVLAALVAAWLLFSRRHGPVAARLRAEGLALVALDDAASLEQAFARFDEALRSAPEQREIEADRALAQVLAATALLEEGEALSARAAARTAERAAAAVAAGPPAAAEPTAAPPEGSEVAPQEADPEVARLEAEARDRTARGTALSRSALETLQRLGKAREAEPEVVRALALLHAAGGERDAVQRQVAAGRARTPDDPWLTLAEATPGAHARDRAGLERAVSALSTLAAAHPELLRGRYLLAAGQARLGRRGEAQALAEGILAANPRHERAAALRAELARPAQPAPPAPASTGATAGNGAAPPRKGASHPAAAPIATAPAARSDPATRSPATARSARTGTAVPAHPPTIATSPEGRVDGSQTTTGAAGGGMPAPPTDPPAGAPHLRPRAAPAASPVEYGGGR